MDVPAITRLAVADPAVVSGLIEEHVALRLTEAGPEPWARDHARWRGVRDALEAAAEGAEPTHWLDRPPGSLQGATRAAVRRMATSWVGGDGFMTVRVLERLGLVELDHDDDYILAVIGGLVGDPRFAATTRADVLRADPELREAIIWRVFEVEGGGEVSLANLDKFCRSESRRWSTTFHELVEDGTLRRDAVLSAALGALARDFSAYRAGWFSRLYRSFDPTPAESAERQAALRHLLRSNVTATVTLALRCLLDVARAGLADDDETALALGPALRHENRTTADAAVTLAEGIATRRPDLADIVAGQLSAALSHPHADVQTRAARLMQALGAVSRIEEHVAEMSPAVVSALGLGGGPLLASEPSTSAAVPNGPSLPADALSDPTIHVVEGPELVELMAALLEDASDPTAVESVLAGLASAGASNLLAPLDRRATTVLERGPREGVTPGWLRGQLARLVRRSAGQAPPTLHWGWDTQDGPPDPRRVALRFLARRIDDVGDIATGTAAPTVLVATPEHPAGWIRPETLVARVTGGTAATSDLVAGILRLGPEGRQAALTALDRGGLPGNARLVERVLRHALGDVPPKGRPFDRRPDASGKALWTAAARARSPLATDAWAAHLGLTGSGRAEPLSLRLRVPLPWDGDTSDVRDEHLPWVVVATPVSDGADDQPTAARGVARPSMDWSDAEDFVRWVATVFPADAEHLAWVTGYGVVLRALSYAEVQHDAVRVLDALRDHQGRVGTLTQAVLVAGLSAAGVDERVRAVDAVARLATTGQLTAAGLAEGIVTVGPITPLTRLARSLRDLAATAPAANDLVVEALAHALPRAPIASSGMHALLEVLLDETIRTGRRTPSHMAPWLAQFRGTSRAASLAAGLSERL